MASGNTQQAAKVWNAILGIAEMTIPRSSYKTWLEKTTALSCVDEELFISVPDAFTAQYIQERLMVVLDTALRDVAGDGFSITLTVEGGKDTDLLPEELSKRVTPTSVNPNFIEQEDDKSATGLQKFNPDYTFDSFIVGDSNELAFAGAKAVAESPGLHFNPLVIYSEVGLGKTHLLHAIRTGRDWRGQERTPKSSTLSSTSKKEPHIGCSFNPRYQWNDPHSPLRSLRDSHTQR